MSPGYRVTPALVTGPRALIGKHPGDIAEVHAPAGTHEYEILDVRYE